MDLLVIGLSIAAGVYLLWLGVILLEWFRAGRRR